MAIESVRDFSSRALFENGETPARLLQVTKVMAHLFRNRSIAPDLHVSHQGRYGNGDVHVGWFAHELATSVDVYDSRAKIVVPSTKKATLFIPEEGGLASCTTMQGAMTEEQILDEYKLGIHDEWLREDEGVLSLLQPVYGTRLAAAAVTYLAGRHGLLEPLRDFAVADRPLSHER